VRQPSRGEVWLVDLGLAAKVRPCLVINVAIEDSDRALLTIVPHTTSLRGTRFECAVPVNFLKPGGFDVQGLLTVPSAKFLRFLGVLKSEQLARVEATLRIWLGLSS
jgi:mRNA interferase MazF